MKVSRPLRDPWARRGEADYLVVARQGDIVRVVRFEAARRKQAAKFSKRLRKAARDAR